jgi:hypothetical protein
MLVTGCSGQSPPAPSALGGVGTPGGGALTDASGGTNMRVTAASSAGRNTTTIHWFADASVVPGASSTLVRTGDSVSMTAHTSGLNPTAAYTVWWVVFNHPVQCATSPCGESDLLDPDVVALVTHAAGHIISPSGTASFAGSLREGAVVHNLLGGSGSLIDTREAEIHFVVRTHGPKKPGSIPEQIHTFEPACVPTVCEDVQFAIHQP